MIGKRLEYEKMYAVERQLWWYRILHQNVQTAIQTYFPDKNIAILDAGCGTGGLLTSLQAQGYTQLSGFDGSADAVEFCQARGLNVTQHNLTHIEAFSPANPLDVIICDDVFCYLTDDEILRVMRCFKNWLKPNGIFISNNNAFKAFYGTHDIAIGSKRRFVVADLRTFAHQTGFQISKFTYWSLALSPLILAVRQWQSLKLRLGWEKPETIVSDVALPPSWVNETLFTLVQWEQKLLPRAPFGSSLFTIMH